LIDYSINERFVKQGGNGMTKTIVDNGRGIPEGIPEKINALPSG
jgi:hypothetical protein